MNDLNIKPFSVKELSQLSEKYAKLLVAGMIDENNDILRLIKQLNDSYGVIRALTGDLDVPEA